MNVLLLLVLAASPPQESTVREELIRLTSSFCDEEHDGRRLARISNAALEVLPAMIRVSDGERRLALLGLYRRIADWKEIPRSPAVLVNLARGGTGPENLAAAEIVMRIRDGRSLDLLVEGLERIAQGERTENSRLEGLLIAAAGGSHSDKVGKVLLGLVELPEPTLRRLVIDSLGTLGYEPALDVLKSMKTGAANHAIEKIGALAPTGLADRLLGRIRGMRMSGEFSWYRWSLDQIVHRNLAEAVPGLRAEYDSFVKKSGTARIASEWAAVLLHAIQKLGGKLSPEETALLQDLGYLPPATKATGPEEKLVEAFDKSVWVKRAPTSR